MKISADSNLVIARAGGEANSQIALRWGRASGESIMVDGKYDDLQLRIDRDADGSYRVLAMAPDGRTARGAFSLPMSDAELDEFVQRVGLARRRSGSPDTRMEAIR